MRGGPCRNDEPLLSNDLAGGGGERPAWSVSVAAPARLLYRHPVAARGGSFVAGLPLRLTGHRRRMELKARCTGDLAGRLRGDDDTRMRSSRRASQGPPSHARGFPPRPHRSRREGIPQALVQWDPGGWRPYRDRGPIVSTAPQSPIRSGPHASHVTSRHACMSYVIDDSWLCHGAV